MAKVKRRTYVDDHGVRHEMRRLVSGAYGSVCNQKFCVRRDAKTRQEPVTCLACIGHGDKAILIPTRAPR